MFIGGIFERNHINEVTVQRSYSESVVPEKVYIVEPRSQFHRLWSRSRSPVSPGQRRIVQGKFKAGEQKQNTEIKQFNLR